MIAHAQISECSHNHRAPYVCSIVPPRLLQEILGRDESSAGCKVAAQKTLNHISKLHSARHSRTTFNHATAPHTHDTLISQSAAAPTAAAKLFRSIYTSSKTNKIQKTLLFNEGASASKMKDESAKEVYDYFGDTWKFYNTVFSRNSIDNKGLHLIGSVHYDDEPGEPGMDNAFWDGTQMAFGDGDGEIFGSFTNSIDVIGHELTHGVTQYTADLEYEFQSGALNESISDVFGSMIKQYFYPGGQQTADKADWLIGEGIFLPSLENAIALRSMKAPGTGYNNPKIGKDEQPATMDGYVNLPNTPAGDSGGVHTNSGIPNHAFYLVATALGGFSWDKAGKIWYAALLDKSLQEVDTKKAFAIFANLTIKYAGSLFDQTTAAVVTKAWTDVKVLKPTTTPPTTTPPKTAPAKGDGGDGEL